VTQTQTLDVFLSGVRAGVDDALEAYLPRPPACPQIISDAMRYSVFAGGKRLRPSLTLAAANAIERAVRHKRGDRHASFAGHEPLENGHYRLGAAEVAALPAACAIELIHTYSLIHDDLPAMDNDTLRRGRPTLHTVYGEGIAILAGDGLQAEAFALLAREPFSDDPELVRRKLEVIGVIGEAARAIGLVGGQATDLQAAGQVPGHSVTLDGDALRTMHAQKTGALIRASATSGAIMAGGDVPMIEAIDRFATDLGLAFQIIDDILDVEGSAGELGKTVGKDASGSKPTFPALYGLDGSRSLAAECVARAKRTLADALLNESWLPAIADWVVSRRN
jgi:geranylgeranyl diphosphate synthase, type II